MVGRLIITVAALAFVCQADARTIQKVVILETGLNKNPDEDGLSEACKKFKPTVRQVKEFFTKAYIVPHRFSLHERYAPCHATGTLEFSDFGKVEWVLSSGGTGSISWDEGENVFLYYRGYKWLDPTACSYGLGDVWDC